VKTQKPSPAQGIYLRRKTWWLNHTAEGERYYENLKTHDYAEAVKLAEKKRGVVPESVQKVGDWEKAISRYLREKTTGIRPKHLAGKRVRQMRKSGDFRVRSCLNVFAKWSGLSSPSAVRISHLQKYYEKRRKASEAGARSTIATIQAFLDHMGLLRERVMYALDKKLESRKEYISLQEAGALISKCTDDKLKFVLFCGFHAGMRKSEIMNAQPSWFNVESRILTIPCNVDVTLQNGQKAEWMTKDGESRSIPISMPFLTFLKAYLPACKGYCLPSRRKGSATGLYDFRAPYKAFMEECGYTKMTIHAMRHSYISGLANSGNHSITEISAWSGDTLETIERNYWKKTAQVGALDDTFAGKRKGDDGKEALSLMRDIKAAQPKPEDMTDLFYVPN
jgi:integrase